MSLALITGISGQDGHYLAERLRALGQDVLGTTHRSAQVGSLRLAGGEVPVVEMSLSDGPRIAALIREHQPQAIYNFAARASSAQLFDDAVASADINGVGVARILEAIRAHSPHTRFCQASSSEVFGRPEVSPQNERTARAPHNAYGAAKAFADHLIGAYRSEYGLFACSAVLFPHESPRRDVHFLTRKVARAAVRIAAGLQEHVSLGDLAATRDWGYAPDYVEAMRRMLERASPEDLVIASGTLHSVADVCAAAFGHVGLDWQTYVRVDPALKRAAEPVPRVGDASRARSELGWAPSVTFAELMGLLVASERAALSGEPAHETSKR
jgi:GDPmannose 4,6-dehydratase